MSEDKNKVDSPYMTQEEFDKKMKYMTEVFPKLPFPRDWSDASIIGLDWKFRLSDVYHQKIDTNDVNVPIIMEQFCWFVANREPIPIELSSYVAQAFHDYLRGGQSLEVAFQIKGGVGANRKRDYDGNPYPKELCELMWEVVVNNLTIHKAKLINKKSESTLNDYLKKADLVDDALFHFIMTFETTKYRHLNEEEQERLKVFVPNYKYVAFNQKETLAKIKKKDEEFAEEMKLKARRTQFDADTSDKSK